MPPGRAPLRVAANRLSTLIMRILNGQIPRPCRLTFSDAARHLVVQNQYGSKPYLEVHDLHTDRPPAQMDRFPLGRWLAGYSDAADRVRFVSHPPGVNNHQYNHPGTANRNTGLSADGGRAVVASIRSPANTAHLHNFTFREGEWHPTWDHTSQTGYFGGPMLFFGDAGRLFVCRWEYVRARSRLHLHTQRLVFDAADGRVLSASPLVVGEVTKAACGFGSGLVVVENVVQKRIERSCLLIHPDGAVDGEPIIPKQRGVVSAIAGHEPLLLSASGTKVTVWDAATWKPLHKFDWKIGNVSCLAISDDGTVAAAGGDKGKVAVWDVG